MTRTKKSTRATQLAESSEILTNDTQQDKPTMPKKYVAPTWGIAYLGCSFGNGHVTLDSALRSIENVPNRKFFSIVAPNGARLSYEAASLL